MSNDELLTHSPLLESVRASLPDNLSVYLVGGAIRDALLRRVSHDLDFVLDRDGIKTARWAANALKADFYPLDPERDTGRVIVMAEDGTRTFMDFATFRGPNLEADLAGRDFTVNAIAMDVRSGELHDPLSGVMDLKEKQLRACSDHAFGDDPVRILRGVRLAAGHGFHILAGTQLQMKQAVEGLLNVSPERLRDEIFRILEGPQAAPCIQALDLLGALELILPEIAALKGVEQSAPHIQDVWTHTLSTLRFLELCLEALASDYREETASDLFHGLLVLRLGRFRQQFAEYFGTPLNINRSMRGLVFMEALFHDVGKPACRKIEGNGQVRFLGHDQRGAELAAERAHQLSMSNDEADRISLVIRNHMRIHYLADRFIKEHKEPTRRSIYRFFRDMGSAGVDLVLLVLADCRATYENTLPQETWAAYLEVSRLLLENWWEKREESIAPPPLINGNELMKVLKLQPGPGVGKILEAVREAQAIGKIKNWEEAIAFALESRPKGTGKE